MNTPTLSRINVTELQNMYQSIQDVWDEVDQRKEFGFSLEPDWGMYKVLEQANSLYAYRINSKGFALFINVPDHHRVGKVKAVSDVIYLPLDSRGSFEECLPQIKQDLKNGGADFISITLKSREQDSIYGLKLYEKTYQGKI